ncbi:MAG TPA: hypothetical protein VKA08_16990 [Balneolales bacterium]|nr:hypothetical protein [Balneolales bacterium]
MSNTKSIAVILGSAYQNSDLSNVRYNEISVDTSWGTQTIYRVSDTKMPAYLLYRHNRNDHLLPHQIPYRRMVAALKEVNCGALVSTSSAAALVTDISLFKPLLITDIIMPENRLPDGSTCTMFPEHTDGQGHLILSEGLISQSLNAQLKAISKNIPDQKQRDIVFAYAGGPRSKTQAENRMWALLGAHVNSMTLAPEIVLANEMEIPCAGFVIAHKYSIPGISNPKNSDDIDLQLQKARDSFETIITRFLMEGQPVPFANHIYRYDDRI